MLAPDPAAKLCSAAVVHLAQRHACDSFKRLYLERSQCLAASQEREERQRQRPPQTVQQLL